MVVLIRLVLLLGLTLTPDRGLAQGKRPRLPEAALTLSLRDATKGELLRLAFLEESLRQLAKADRDRVWSGWLQVGLGAVFGGAAGFAKEPELRGMLGLSAAVTLGRGIAALSIANHADRALADLDRLPLLSPAGLRARLAAGEKGLAHVARRGRLTRIVQGSLTMFGALAFVPLSYGLARAEDPSYRFGSQAIDYVGLSLSVIGFASGAVQTFVNSPAERGYALYRELPR